MTSTYLKRIFSRSSRKAAVLQGTGFVIYVPGRNAAGMSRAQEVYLEGNSERLGIALQKSKRPYAASSAVLPNRNSGREFDKLNGVAHEVFRVFLDDAIHFISPPAG